MTPPTQQIGPQRTAIATDPAREDLDGLPTSLCSTPLADPYCRSKLSH